MFTDSFFHLNEHLTQLMEEYEQNLDKRGYDSSDLFWGRLVGMHLDVHTIGALSDYSGTMTITNVSRNNYRHTSGKRGIYRFELEVDRRYWEGRRICFLEFKDYRRQTFIVTEGPGEPINVNAYIVHEKLGKAE